MKPRYLPEIRERALRMLDEARLGHASLSAASRHVAGMLGMTAETLRVWHRQRSTAPDKKTGSPADPVEECRRLRRENTELRKANEILRAASVFFVKELDRPSTK
jgi:transposase